MKRPNFPKKRSSLPKKKARRSAARPGKTARGMASRALRKPKTSGLRRIGRKVRETVRQILSPILPEVPESLSSGSADRRLPDGYGDTKLVLLVRDPWWLFAYWEIEASREATAREAAHRRGGDFRTVLRVYDVTGLDLPRKNSFFDIELNFHATNWYIDVGLPNRDWVAEIGYRFDDGHFIGLVRSNRVRTPSFGLSDVLDEEWMLPDDVYFRILGRSVSVESQGSSMDIRRLLERYLQKAVSSERSAPARP